MARFDIEAIRSQIRAMDFVQGTPTEVAMWRENDAESRANLAIEGKVFDPDEEALFNMMLDEAVPPALVTQTVLKQLEQTAADQSSEGGLLRKQ